MDACPYFLRGYKKFFLEKYFFSPRKAGIRKNLEGKNYVALILFPLIIRKTFFYRI